MRIDKFLSNKRLVSRKNVNKFLKDNFVTINDTRIKKKDYKLVNGDELKINDIVYNYEEYIYLLINKPKGYICSNKDELYPSILNLIDPLDFQMDLFCVGRLDVDTTGCLLITNDGQFSHNLLSPKKHVDKTYLVTLKDSVKKLNLELIKSGININDEYITKPAQYNIIDDFNILLTIQEGKYHQVKRMFTSLGSEVINLHRESFSKYNVENLKLGEYIKIKQS